MDWAAPPGQPGRSLGIGVPSTPTGIDGSAFLHAAIASRLKDSTTSRPAALAECRYPLGCANAVVTSPTTPGYSAGALNSKSSPERLPCTTSTTCPSVGILSPANCGAFHEPASRRDSSA